MQKTTFIRDVWLILVIDETTPFELRFLYDTGGDWGPAYLPTNDIFKAIRFSSKKDALEFIKDEHDSGWVMKPYKVKETIELAI